jgi:hypothetical protein
MKYYFYKAIKLLKQVRLLELYNDIIDIII